MQSIVIANVIIVQDPTAFKRLKTARGRKTANAPNTRTVRYIDGKRKINFIVVRLQYELCVIIAQQQNPMLRLTAIRDAQHTTADFVQIAGALQQFVVLSSPGEDTRHGTGEQLGGSDGLGWGVWGGLESMHRVVNHLYQIFSILLFTFGSSFLVFRLACGVRPVDGNGPPKLAASDRLKFAADAEYWIFLY